MCGSLARRLELPLGAERVPKRDRQAAALARARAARRESRHARRRPSRCRPARRAARPARHGAALAVSASAGSARLPTITGWTNSTATWRASERSCGEAPNASSRPPRAKRSAMRWQSARDPLGLGGEERSPAFAAAASARRPAVARRSSRDGTLARVRTLGRSQLAHTLHRPRPCGRSQQLDANAGMNGLEVVQELLERRSRDAGSRSILLTITSSHARNISGYFSGLSSPSVTEVDHRARVLADAKLRRADEVADVLDDQQVDLVERHRRERRAHHVRVEMALAAEARRRC